MTPAFSFKTFYFITCIILQAVDFHSFLLQHLFHLQSILPIRHYSWFILQFIHIFVFNKMIAKMYSVIKLFFPIIDIFYQSIYFQGMQQAPHPLYLVAKHMAKMIELSI